MSSSRRSYSPVAKAPTLDRERVRDGSQRHGSKGRGRCAGSLALWVCPSIYRSHLFMRGMSFHANVITDAQQLCTRLTHARGRRPKMLSAPL